MGAAFEPSKASADWRPGLQVQLWADLAHVNQAVHAVCSHVHSCVYLTLCKSGFYF